MELKETIQKIRKLISDDKLEEAISELAGVMSDDKELDEVILQSARFVEISKFLRQGTISFEKASITKNQIRLALLDLLRFIEEEKEKSGRKKKTGIAYLLPLMVLLLLAGGYLVYNKFFWKEIKGRIIDESTKEAVTDVKVFLWKPKREFKTDSVGGYHFQIPFYHKPPFVVSIKKEGYREQLDTIRVENQIMNHKIFRQ